MDNAYYILAKKRIDIERFHICTWELPMDSSYIEFGFEFSINSYENAIENLKENHPKVPLILFNCGCAYYFKKDKKKSIEFLSRAINGFCNLNYSDNYFGYKPKPEDIKKKIETARSLIEVLQREK